MNRIATGIMIVAVFAAGAWSGYSLRYAQTGMFGYDPCFSTLSDVRREARAQNIHQEPWADGRPPLTNDCVFVDEDRTYNGWREDD